MTDNMNRTADWSRLSQTAFLTVQDDPGRIVISRTSPMEKKLNWVLLMGIGFPVGSILLGQLMGGTVGAYAMGFVGILVASIIIFGGFIPAKARLARYADCVVFTPEGVTFFQGGQNMGWLRREAMQQIVADCDHDNLRYHRFIADNGYMSAFPMSDKTDHLLINNILMVAFSQPLHLDLFTTDVAIKKSLQPDVQGLKSMFRI